MSDEFVKNPETGRPVKVGGRIWHRLLKKGLIKNTDYKDPNILATIEEDENVKVKRFEINQSLPPEIEAVTGRGKYKNKIVKRKLPLVRKKPPVEIQQTQDESDTSDTDSDDDIKDMILNQLNQLNQLRMSQKNKKSTTDTDYTTEHEYTTTDVEEF